MALSKNCKSLQFVNYLCAFTFCFILLSCYSRKPNSIPDAPPPYPSFPFPQDKFKNANEYNPSLSPDNAHEVINSEKQDHMSGTYDPNGGKNYNYIPPSAPPPSSSIQTPAFSPLATNADTPRFTLTAKGDLWALVQDGKGNEIEWLKMKTGESAFIYDPNALVITCSSGNLLSIKNSNGKDISFDSRGNGISIIRLPK